MSRVTLMKKWFAQIFYKERMKIIARDITSRQISIICLANIMKIGYKIAWSLESSYNFFFSARCETVFGYYGEARHVESVDLGACQFVPCFLCGIFSDPWSVDPGGLVGAYADQKIAFWLPTDVNYFVVVASTNNSRLPIVSVLRERLIIHITNCFNHEN